MNLMSGRASHVFVQPTLFVGLGPSGGRGCDDLISDRGRDRQERYVCEPTVLVSITRLSPCRNGSWSWCNMSRPVPASLCFNRVSNPEFADWICFVVSGLLVPAAAHMELGVFLFVFFQKKTQTHDTEVSLFLTKWGHSSLLIMVHKPSPTRGDVFSRTPTGLFTERGLFSCCGSERIDRTCEFPTTPVSSTDWRKAGGTCRDQMCRLWAVIDSTRSQCPGGMTETRCPIITCFVLQRGVTSASSDIMSHDRSHNMWKPTQSAVLSHGSRLFRTSERVCSPDIKLSAIKSLP